MLNFGGVQQTCPKQIQRFQRMWFFQASFFLKPEQTLCEFARFLLAVLCCLDLSKQRVFW